MATRLDSLLDVDAAATFLAVTHSWLYANADSLPTLRLGKQLRWRREDLDVWLETTRRHDAA